MTASVSVSAGFLLAGTGTVSALYSGDGVYGASAGTASIGLNLPASGSLVIPSISPNPVTQSNGSWPFTVTLTEKAGVATKLTGLLIGGLR